MTSLSLTLAAALGGASLAAGLPSRLGAAPLSPPDKRELPSPDDSAARCQLLATEVPELAALTRVPGVAIAVTGPGGWRWDRGFGRGAAPTGDGSTNGSAGVSGVDTVFEAASLSKPVFAYAVLQLVDEGLVDLDTPLIEYAPLPDLAHDPRHERLTARMVLSHSTGLPNWRPDGGPLEFSDDPGTGWRYSGEGYVLLQRVVEARIGDTLEGLARSLVFEPLGMERSSFVWRPEFEDDVALPHDEMGVSLPMRHGTEPNAAYSLLTTAHDYSLFLSALLSGQGLSPELHAAMLAPAVDVNDGVSWGLGVGLEENPDGLAFWHWGHNRGYRAYAVAYPSRGTAVVYFANSDNGMLFLERLVEVATGDDEHPAIEHLDYEQGTGELVDEWRRRAGWRDLFDGHSLAGWQLHGSTDAPGPTWRAAGGCLVHTAGGGDIVFTEPFTNLELEFEWQVADGGNSGVKYRVPIPENGPGARAMLGPEYQVLDDTGHKDAQAPLHRAGALYDVVAPEGSPVADPGADPGVFHRARILADGDRLEHWLDGVRVVQVDRGSERWAQALASSKFSALPDFGAARPGLIGLQDHGDDVRYRNIRLRDLEDLPGEAIELFDGETLAGWKVLGDAIYEVDGGSILGRIGGGGQSFLVTERSYGDFLFEVEVKTELPGNSGIQVRSHVNEKGRLYGYQIEIDSSERAWSGGLYDEARRGWLDDLAEDEYARSAFRYQEWNHYRIECVGPTIRAWVNGIPTADFVDHEDAEGVIGLQVHSGNDTRVRWRNFRMRDLGKTE